jgi:L-asparaginase
MDEAVRRVAAQGIPVVMTNRGGIGRSTETAGRAKEARPLVFGDNLTPQKARILLMLALTTTRDPAEIQRIFERY